MKGKKMLLSALLIIVMAVTAGPSVAAEAEGETAIQITEIKLEGLSFPVEGEVPDLSYQVPQSEHCHIKQDIGEVDGNSLGEYYVWSIMEEPGVAGSMEEDEQFQAGQDYCLAIGLEADDGYVFGEGISVPEIDGVQPTYGVMNGCLILGYQFTVRPVNSTYKVEHYLQNLDGSTYTLDVTEEKTGKIGEKTEAQVKTYEGFSAGLIPQQTVEADGSTVVKIYYQRNKYPLTWDLDGGTATGSFTEGEVYYGESVTAPVVTNDSKKDYVFQGWDVTPVATMPAHELKYTAQWREKADITAEEICNAEEGSNIPVELTEDHHLSAQILEAAKGKNITLKISPAASLEWVIKGTDIPLSARLSDLNLGVILNPAADSVPEEKIKEVAGNNDFFVLRLEHDGEFPFPVKMKFNVEKKNIGKLARRYLRVSEDGKLELQEISEVQNSDNPDIGTATFTFEHASDYVIVLEDKPAEKPVHPEKKADPVISEPENEIPKTGDKGYRDFVAFLSVVAFGVVMLPVLGRRKKKTVD